MARTTRISCLSATGIIAALVTLLAISGVSLARGGVLFSPGDLSAVQKGQPLGGVAAHAETAGRCAACHTAIWEQEKMSDRCLVCHASLLQDRQAFHSVMLAQSKSLECAHCHTEHNGSQASLNMVQMERFPHNDDAGFSLQSHQQTPSGASFECTDCHAERITKFQPRRCLECHLEMSAAQSEAHAADFGQACLGCHDGLETYGALFDHNQTAFPLDGGHTAVTCAGCHAGAVTIADLKDTRHECAFCHNHEDPHAGQFGRECHTCHNPQGWNTIAFDHQQTDYPLLGQHSQVACLSCHQVASLEGTSTTCIACHALSDPHNAQFGQECATCHTPEYWKQVNFDHTQSRFQLTGAHTAVLCSQCHVNGQFVGVSQDCVGCHADPNFHRGLLGFDCVTCHDTSAWTPAAFKQAHRFPLNHGESGNSSCRTCHPSAARTYSCYGCHEHNQAEIERKHREEGIGNFANCVRCHPTGREEGEGRGDGDGD